MYLHLIREVKSKGKGGRFGCKPFCTADSACRYAYDFDEIGNRESFSERGTNSVYAANQLNQYTAVDGFTPQFDDDGNQTLIKTAAGIWQVTYNGENRPILWQCVSTNSLTLNSLTPSLLSMSYDRMGRRVTKNDQSFVYDGYLQIANSELQTPNSRLQTFIWDPIDPVATRPLVWLHGTSAAYYTFDGNKNVSEVIAADGTLAAHYEYAPFGVLTVSRGTSAADNPWRFSSEYAEDDTLTVYFNYRHYEPITGRWMSRDPIPTDALGISSYDFCLQNAISVVDILGLKEGGCNPEFISSHSVSILPMIGCDVFSGITDKFNSKIKLKWVELSASFSVDGSVTFENKRCSCCMREGDVTDEIWKGAISGAVTLDVYSHHDSLTVSGLEVTYWLGAKGAISGTITGSIGGSSDRCNGRGLEATLSYSLGVRGSVDLGGSFTIKLARFISYTVAAYGGFSAGYDFSREYKKHGAGPWVLVKEESGWSGDFHVHFDFGFASYDYTRELF